MSLGNKQLVGWFGRDSEITVVSLVDVHAFFVRNIYNEKKEKKVKKGEKIDRDTWAYSRFRRGGKERRYSCRRQKKKKSNMFVLPFVLNVSAI